MHRRLIALALALPLAILPSFVHAQPQRVDAAGFCQCTTFDYNYEQAVGKTIASNYPNADQWPGWLGGQSNWHRDGSPHSGDVIVVPDNTSMPLSGGGYWTSGSVGHVAIVKSVQSGGGSSFTIVMEGANQNYGTQFTAYGCTDVSDLTVTVNTGVEQFWYPSY